MFPFVCAIKKHPLMEVMATSRKIMYIKFWPVIAEFKKRGLSFFFPKIELREIQTTNFRETSGQNKYSLFWPVMAGVSLLLRFFLCKDLYLCFYPHLLRDRVSKTNDIMDACLHKIF